MDAALATLALTGGTTVVAAMATEAWQATRDAVVRLFRRGGEAQQAAIEAQLEGNTSLIVQAEDGESARRGLVPLWQMQLEALLREDPSAAGELQALVERTTAGLRREQQDWIQTNIARGGGQVFASLGGNVIVHQSGPDRSVPPRPAPEDGEAEQTP